jgi:hypothetical protein
MTPCATARGIIASASMPRWSVAQMKNPPRGAGHDTSAPRCVRSDSTMTSRFCW